MKKKKGGLVDEADVGAFGRAVPLGVAERRSLYK